MQKNIYKMDANLTFQMPPFIRKALDVYGARKMKDASTVVRDAIELLRKTDEDFDAACKEQEAIALQAAEMPETKLGEEVAEALEATP